MAQKTEQESNKESKPMDGTFGAQNPPAWQPSQFSSKGKIS